MTLGTGGVWGIKYKSPGKETSFLKCVKGKWVREKLDTCRQSPESKLPRPKGGSYKEAEITQVYQEKQ